MLLNAEKLQTALENRRLLCNNRNSELPLLVEATKSELQEQSQTEKTAALYALWASWDAVAADPSSNNMGRLKRCHQDYIDLTQADSKLTFQYYGTLTRITMQMKSADEYGTDLYTITVEGSKLVTPMPYVRSYVREQNDAMAALWALWDAWQAVTVWPSIENIDALKVAFVPYQAINPNCWLKFTDSNTIPRNIMLCIGKDTYSTRY